MTTNYMVCNCKQISYDDIVTTLHNMNKIEDVVSTFDDVQKITQCSTGCGGCHDKVMKIISDTMYGYDSEVKEGCNN